MKCVFCGGKTEKKKVTFRYEEDDKYLFVEHVPARLYKMRREDVFTGSYRRTVGICTGGI